jgi:ParB family chromosome partitioning protein
MTEPALLERLALERLEREAEAVRAGEGWRWVEVRTSLSYTDRQAFDHCRTLDVDPSEEQQERLDAIEALVSELEAKIDDLGPRNRQRGHRRAGSPAAAGRGRARSY